MPGALQEVSQEKKPIHAAGGAAFTHCGIPMVLSGLSVQ